MATKHFDQLCALTRLALKPGIGENVRELITAADVEPLVMLASRHRISPFLGRLAQDPEASANLPDELAGFFRLMRENNAARNVDLRRHLVTIIGLLNRIGVEPILLKGAARLVDGTYDDPADRFMLDLDLMVPTDTIDRVMHEFQVQGYTFVPRAGHRPDEHHHQLPLAIDGTAIEIHRSAGPVEYSTLLPNEQLWARSLPVCIDGLNARLLDPVDSLVHMIVHGQLQHGRFLAGRIELREVVELARRLHHLPANATQVILRRAEHAGYAAAFKCFFLTAESTLHFNLLPYEDHSITASLLSSRALWQQNSQSWLRLSAILYYIIWISQVYRKFPSKRHRFPRRLLEQEFYSNRLKELRRL
ncbi:nucleotidyltransferase family protein [Geminicoccus harenae]|uniref:nucleotidyltransferase family protein n=1 Tax=Geminicoccus harenae TaxID=2498453 RepID=UPI00168BBFF3|nr:nucleotidyltransferase family protein [Geminicoccus harenae]